MVLLVSERPAACPSQLHVGTGAAHLKWRWIASPRGGIAHIGLKHVVKHRVEVYGVDTIDLRMGARVCWTRNDATHGLVNSGTAEVSAVKESRVSFLLEAMMSASTRPRPHRGQLVDVAHDQQRGFVGMIRHCQPVEAIATTTFTIPRRSDLRGRPIRLGGGMKGSIGATRGRSTPLRDAGRRADTPGGRLRSRHLWSRSAS